jgi:ribosomal-protein-alanine N-acetyltransferase
MLSLSENKNRLGEFCIEPLQESDIGEVAQIEEFYGLDRWADSTHRQVMTESPQAIMLVARPTNMTRSERRLLGFLCSRVVADEWHVYNIATHPEHRRQGIASSLMRQGMARAQALGAVTGFLEVRTSNQPARALYERLGFIAVSRRRAFYHQPTEDGLVMRCLLLR